MTGHVEMQDLASSMLYHEETIQELEGQRGHREEIHGHDHLALIGEETSQHLAESPRCLVPRRYLATVRSAISKPIFRSSPWIFGAPQVGFSIARRRIRVLSSLLTFGRPPAGRDFHFPDRR